MEPEQRREYVTNVDIRVVWADPANGIYLPYVSVSGDVPDALDRVQLIDHFIGAVHAALVDPSLATSDSVMGPEGFMLEPT